MIKILNDTNLSYFISKMKSAFWQKTDAVQIGIDNTPTDSSTNFITSGGVYSAIHTEIETSQPAGGMLPNIMYNLGTLSENTTFTLAAPADNTIVNHYYWTFDTGSTAPTITWPNSITWLGGSAPTINSNKHYEISVLNGIGTFMEV